MMLRKIIKIDEEKCNGCGLCVTACHEGAIGMIDGKARLLRDDYCDGLGDCLPVCPTDAISFEEREAAAFDAEAVQANMARMAQEKTVEEQKAPQPGDQDKPLPCGCPGMASKALRRTEAAPPDQAEEKRGGGASQLNQWPVQIKLVPVNAPYFQDAKLLIAADCTAFAYGDFHERFMKDKITLIGCPKLDAGDYSEKLTAILKENEIKSVTVVKMEVPCCTGLAGAAITALKNSGKMIPWQMVTLSCDGRIIEE